MLDTPGMLISQIVPKFVGVESNIFVTYEPSKNFKNLANLNLVENSLFRRTIPSGEKNK